MPHMEGIFINGEKAKFHPEDILDANASQYTEEIGTATKEWLSENLTPESAGVVDKTLSIEGAAADAKETGDRIDELKSDLTQISEITKNLFDGTFSAFSNMGLDGEKVKNTGTDSRGYFLCVVRFRNDATNITSSSGDIFNTTGRKSVTVTPTSSGNNIMVLHNGAQRNLSFTIPFEFTANTTYTISFNLEGYDTTTVGGVVISDIQIEEGSTATAYIEHVSAVDREVRIIVDNQQHDFTAICEKSDNLFGGQYSNFASTELVNGKIKNTNTDTRTGFFFGVYLRNGSSNVTLSTVQEVWFKGRVRRTITATGDGDSIRIQHNGLVRNISVDIPFNVVSGKTYTVSINVEGYDVQTVGGLVFSDIQIEEGNIETPYIPDVSAVDFVAREMIKDSITEKELNVLLMGDSIFGNDGEIALYLDRMCKSCTNGAFGGTRVSVRSGNDNFKYFDGVNIITALCDQTWTDQDTAAESLASDYPWITARLAELKAVDMSKIDLLIMDWGTNDYTASATIEDITTAYGTVIDMLQTTYPTLRILITTPIWRYWGVESDNENGDTKVYNVSTLKEIALAIEDFMKNKRISVLNAYQNLPLSYKTALTYFDANDKTHLNTFGNKVYAHLLHGKIRSIF